MNTAASISSSWLDGSPSRQSPNRRTPRKSPLKELYESPSRQMQTEFSLLLLRSDNDFNERLDQAAAERAKLHEEQLTKAAHEHQKVQEGARLEIQRLVLEQELEMRRREEAQRQENERLNQEKLRREAEAQRQKLEATRREEEATRQAAERQRQIQEADARVRAQKEQQEEATRRQKEDAEKKAREAADAAQQARTQQQKQPPPAAVVPATPVPPSVPIARPTPSTASPTPGVEELHAKYLELHARMKTFRTEFVNKHKQMGDPLKGPVGDTRRNMRKRLGQVTTERKDSQAAIGRLRAECFDKALQTPGPLIDIRPYIVSHQIPQLSNEADAQYPALLLYAWICFEKSVIQQWNQEAASEDHTIIQELGLIAASLYSDPKYQWKGAVPLTDTLLAKLHRVCPMMFGISGNMTTKQGLARLGLDKYGGSDTNLNSYLQMATGVGAGYAALSLRQFSGKNPAVPMADYWRAVAFICNTPSEALYPGHFMCLKGLLRDFIKKFLTFYGAPAKAVVRRATRSLPDRAPRERPGMKDAADIVRTMPDTWKRTVQIDIDR
jgi:nucleoporin GLE1